VSNVQIISSYTTKTKLADIDKFTSCKVYRTIDFQDTLQIEIPASDDDLSDDGTTPIWKNITTSNLLKVNVKPLGVSADWQYYDLVRTERIRYPDGTRTVKAEAENVSYRLNSEIVDETFIQVYAMDALNTLLADTIFSAQILATFSGTKSFAFTGQNKREALVDIAQAWGAELSITSGGVIQMQSQVGRSSGAPTLQNASNLFALVKVDDVRESVEGGVSGRLDVAELGALTDYGTAYALELGDTVNVIDEELEVDDSLRIVAYELDVLEPIRSTIDISTRWLSIPDTLFDYQRRLKELEEKQEERQVIEGNEPEPYPWDDQDPPPDSVPYYPPDGGEPIPIPLEPTEIPDPDAEPDPYNPYTPTIPIQIIPEADCPYLQFLGYFPLVATINVVKFTTGIPFFEGQRADVVNSDTAFIDNMKDYAQDVWFRVINESKAINFPPSEQELFVNDKVRVIGNPTATSLDPDDTYYPLAGYDDDKSVGLDVAAVNGAEFEAADAGTYAGFLRAFNQRTEAFGCSPSVPISLVVSYIEEVTPLIIKKQVGSAPLADASVAFSTSGSLIQWSALDCLFSVDPATLELTSSYPAGSKTVENVSLVNGLPSGSVLIYNASGGCINITLGVSPPDPEQVIHNPLSSSLGEPVSFLGHDAFVNKGTGEPFFNQAYLAWVVSNENGIDPISYDGRKAWIAYSYEEDTFRIMYAWRRFFFGWKWKESQWQTVGGSMASATDQRPTASGSFDFIDGLGNPKSESVTFSPA